MSPTIETWLATALRDAPSERRERLRAEILAHLAEAQAAYQAAGLDAAAAAHAALADLGDPRATARSLRQAFPRPLQERLRAAGPRWGVPLLLVVLALLGTNGLLAALRLPPGSELGAGTGLALILQVATLTLTVSLPLLFDDVDLSAGVVVMLGVVLVRAPGAEPPSVWPTTGAAVLPSALLGASLAGAGIGLLHGLLMIATRLPAALVTLTGGIGLAVALLAHPHSRHLTLNSEERLTTLAPTIALAIAAVALLSFFSLVAAACWRTPGPPPGPPPTPGLRRAELVQGTLLALPLVLALGQARMAWSSPSSLLLVAVVGGATVVGLCWAVRATGAGVRRRRVAWLTHLAPLALLLTIGADAVRAGVEQPAYALGAPMWSLLLLVLATPVALAVVVGVRGLWASSGRRWFGLTRPTREAALPRIAALVLSGALAGMLGVCLGAQGLRDGTFVHATAFYVLMPLAGVVLGGQHLLPPTLRPLGAILGALAVASLTPLGSDNLDTHATALLLAGLAAGLWRLVLPPARQRAATDGATTKLAAELHRRLHLV